MVASKPNIQFACWATTPIVALDVAEHLRAALLGGSYCVTVGDERTMRDPQAELFRRDVDVGVLHDGE